MQEGCNRALLRSASLKGRKGGGVRFSLDNETAGLRFRAGDGIMNALNSVVKNASSVKRGTKNFERLP